MSRLTIEEVMEMAVNEARTIALFELIEYKKLGTVEEFAKLIKKTESIVTCGECKFKKTQRCPQSQPITSDKHPFSFSGWGTPSDDYYCASGERRE